MRRTPRRSARFALTASVAVAAVPMLLTGLAAPAAAAGPVAAHRHGHPHHTVYVDCGADAAGTGSARHPLASLDAVNALNLAPGERVLFARGSTCTGTLQPGDSGTARAPIVIGAYGHGAKPVIDGHGAHDAVLLQNIDHITVQDLDITNATDPGTRRNGVRIHLRDVGEASGFTLQRLDIHDVMGDDTKGMDGSAAIQIGIDGDTTPTWIDGLDIRDNTLHHDGREGIYFKSTWNKRPEVGSQDTSGLGPWTPSTHVQIVGNTLTSIAGDGIKVDTAKDALIAHNTLAGFQLRSGANNAGIWPFNADGTVVEYNDVSGGGSDHDGMSFDADGGSQNTVFQYNYSHDNKGGLLLVCPYSGAWTHGTVMRYNISRNDGARLFQFCPGDVRGTSIYNNTIVNDTVAPRYFLQDDNSTKRDATWSNNIVVNTTGTPMTVQDRGPVLTFRNNLIRGVTGIPANADGAVNPGGVDAVPGFTDAAHTPRGIHDLRGLRLRQGSHALRAGTVIADNGGRDFFGNRVSRNAAPNIGAYDGHGIHVFGDPADLRLHAGSLLRGVATTVTVDLTWWGPGAKSHLVAALHAPKGWKVGAPQSVSSRGLERGGTIPLTFSVTPPADAAQGTATLSASLTSHRRTIAHATTDVTIEKLYSSIEEAYNDVAITADGAEPYTGDMALSMSSLSSNELKKVKGIAPGASVAGEKVTYTWPDFTPGEDNAVWSLGQNIAVHGQGADLGFVLFSINGYPTPPSGTASVTYTDGTSASFTLSAGDYYYNKPAAGNTVFTTMAYRNTPTGTGAGPFSLYESTIPIDLSKTVAYVTLPQGQKKVDGKTPALMVLAIGVG